MLVAFVEKRSLILNMQSTLFTKKIWIKIFLFTLGMFFCIQQGVFAAEVTRGIGFQGELFSGSTPVNTSVNAEFTFYDALTDGVAQGTPITKTVSVVNGYFGTDFSELDMSGVDFSQSLWVEVRINGTTLSPRSRIHAVPVANNALGVLSYATAPTVGPSGALYYDTIDEKLFVSNGSGWNPLLSTTTEPLGTSTIRNLFSTSISGLEYATSTGILSLTSGYAIPTTASTSEWDSKVSSQWTSTSSNIFFTDGNVGVGTSDAIEKLTVLGNITSTGFIQATNGVFRGDDQYHQIVFHNGGNNTDYFEWGDTLANGGGHRFFTDGDNFTLRMQVANNGTYIQGPVGIGTTTPSAKLAVTGTAGTDDIFAIASSTNTRIFSVGANSNVTVNSGSLLVNGGDMISNGNWSFRVNGGSAGFIVNGTNGSVSRGYVGIADGNLSGAYRVSLNSELDSQTGLYDLALRNAGTGSISQAFKVYNTYTDANNYERATLGWVSNALNIGTENSGTGVARALNFITGSTTRMTIDTSGNVGIGTVSPSQKLEVNGNIQVAGTNSLYFYATMYGIRANSGLEFNTASGDPVGFKWTTGGSTETMRLSSTGNLGIGTTSPSAKLAVTGTAGTGDIFVVASSTNTNLMTLAYDGNLRINAGISTAANPIGISPVNTAYTFFQPVSNRMGISRFGAEALRFDSSSLTINSSYYTNGLTFGTPGSPDSGITRSAAGLLEINNGSAGTLRDLTLRSLTSSGTSTFTGNVGIGTTSPQVKLHIEQTTEQLRLGYDASNYVSFTTGSSGGLTISQKVGSPLILGSSGGSGYGVLKAGSGGAYFEVNTINTLWNDSSGNLEIKNTGVFGWSSTSVADGTKDAGLSRGSANKIYI